MPVRRGHPAPRTLANLDPATPVSDLNDADDAGRDSLILLSDDERYTLAWGIEQMSRRRSAGIETAERREWHQAWWVRVGILVGGLAAVAAILDDIARLSGH